MDAYRDFAYIRTDPDRAGAERASWERRKASDLAVTRHHLRKIREDGFTIHRRDAVTECVGAGVAVSGRPKLIKLLRQLKPMTGLVVLSLDALGRDPIDIAKTIQKVKQAGAQVYCISAWDDDLSESPKFLTALRAFGQLQSKTSEYLASTRGAGLGVHGGRLGRPPSLNEKAQASVRAGLAAGESIASLARRHDTSRQTILRVRSSG